VCRLHYVVAECFNDLPVGWLSNIHNLPGDSVGVDHTCAACFEHLDDSAFATADITG
jgi:hypothetical protein